MMVFVSQEISLRDEDLITHTHYHLTVGCRQRESITLGMLGYFEAKGSRLRGSTQPTQVI
jgi:hypothetical protein